MESGQTRDLIEAMERADFYTPPPASVQLVETHISWVFIAGEHVFKVKKEIVLPFVDYGSLERRRAMCELEVQLNRRLAPDVYIGVRKIVAAGGRHRLAELQEPEEAIEYAVEMSYVDPANRLDQRLSSSATYLEKQIRRLGAKLAAFHDQAPVVEIDPGSVRRWVAEQFEELHDMRGLLTADVNLAATERALTAFLAGHQVLLAERLATGRFRDGHGDLRAEHVILEPDLAVLDCIEFNDALRQVDVTADIAFLIMDLQLTGHSELADALETSYRDAGGDLGAACLVYFYATLRAVIRAKVTLIRATQEDADTSQVVADAVRHLELAQRLRWLARQPVAIVLCGVSGSGKSMLARALAARSGFAHVDSDIVRKRLAGLEPWERAAAQRYSEQFTIRTYTRLAEVAAEQVGRDGGVIVDATFRHDVHRKQFRDVLATVGLVPVFFECRAPPEVLRRRIGQRLQRGGDPSDARPTLVDEQLAEFEQFDDAAFAHEALDATRSPEKLVDDVERALDARSVRS